MRPVLAGDVFAMARHLQQLPRSDRRDQCYKLLVQTDSADKYRKKFNALHPRWGNGSLLSRVSQSGGVARADPAFHSRDFCICAGLVLEELERWRRFKQDHSLCVRAEP